MTRIPKKDPTKSISWLAIDDKTQKQLVKLCYKHLKNPCQKGWTNSSDSKDAYHKIICDLMGVEFKDVDIYPRAVRDFKDVAMSGKGKIFDQMRDFTKKFEEIENAAMHLAEEKGPYKRRDWSLKY